MTYLQAKLHADTLRPNSISDEQKYSWLHELDGKMAELLHVDIPDMPKAPYDADLLVQPPVDNIYELYLIAMYDVYNQDTNLYAMDYQLYNTALEEAKSYIIRNSKPKDQKMWGVM